MCRAGETHLAGMSSSSSFSSSIRLAPGFTNSIFSITRTRTRTRNILIGISGLRHLSLCFQTAPQGPLCPRAVSDKAKRYHKSSIVSIQFSASGGSGLAISTMGMNCLDSGPDVGRWSLSTQVAKIQGKSAVFPADFHVMFYTIGNLSRCAQVHKACPDS